MVIEIQKLGSLDVILYQKSSREGAIDTKILQSSIFEKSWFYLYNNDISYAISQSLI